MRGEGGGCGVSDNEYSSAHEAQVNFGYLTPYLTYYRYTPLFLLNPYRYSVVILIDWIFFVFLAKLNVFAAYAPKDRHIFVYSSNKQINVGKD